MRDREALFRIDEQRDISVCGISLAPKDPERRAAAGAHEPTPTPYFVLDELFDGVSFAEDSHLLDVGCGTGRVLAYLAARRFPGRATGIELDGDLASFAASWASRFANLAVVHGDVLDEPLSGYSHFYLFNPFDTQVLVRFLGKIEAEAAHPITLIHMSDNGERYTYMGRRGWTAEHAGKIQFYRGAAGDIEVYAHPQTYTVWRYDPGA